MVLVMVFGAALLAAFLLFVVGGLLVSDGMQVFLPKPPTDLKHPAPAPGLTDVPAARAPAHTLAPRSDSRPDGAYTRPAAPHHLTGSTAESVSQPRGGS
ncbi:hypothetical protein JHN63_21785 [Streptomyces sp. MBT65]|uniref:hypothetical protein n=1 Tax=Streptomyces sp. MBT65 TaxID=1488395 RepID=UPI00190C7D81|nr:hypothetical protein [Streptomyces sp. MBT65]MBK3576397.1 hypothetical protein [Streptomyces sp. MBT65]